MTDDRERIEVLVTYVRQAQRIGAPVEELRELANSALEAIRVVGDRAATLAWDSAPPSSVEFLTAAGGAERP
jgi:hypothetical protein